VKAGVFDRVVRLESDPHGPSGRLDGPRMSSPAVASEQRGKSVRAVAQFHVVVGAVVGFLDVEFAAEIDAYAVSGRRYTENRCPRACSDAVVSITIRLRFDFYSVVIRPPFDSHSTAIRPHYDRSTTYVTTVGHICRTAVEWESNRNRIVVVPP